MLFFVQMSRACFRCLNEERLRLSTTFWGRSRANLAASWDQFKISMYQIFLWLYWSPAGRIVRNNTLRWLFYAAKTFFCYRKIEFVEIDYILCYPTIWLWAKNWREIEISCIDFVSHENHIISISYLISKYKHGFSPHQTFI